MFVDIDVPEPEVDPGLMWVWRCWHRLNPDRVWHGGGLGPMMPARISWSQLREWAAHHGYSRTDLAFLDTCVQAMDGVFLEIQAARAAAAGKK